MEFIPESKDIDIDVPFYDDVLGHSEEGWSGHTVGDTVNGLKSKISAALGRLDAMVVSFQRGQFKDEKTGLLRQAIRIHYTVASGNDLWPGTIDIAALPVERKRSRDNDSYENKLDKSLRMALYMTLTALQGAWNMKILSPGYAPLIPWMIAPESDGKTFSQTWQDFTKDKLLSAPEMKEAEVVDGEFEEI